jgi:pterin-4a-carbinolamine dehydratase
VYEHAAKQAWVLDQFRELAQQQRTLVEAQGRELCQRLLALPADEREARIDEILTDLPDQARHLVVLAALHNRSIFRGHEGPGIFNRRSVMNTMYELNNLNDAEATPKKLTRPRGEKLKAERVQEKLRSMPGWRLALEGKALSRVREFPDSEVASAFATFAGAFTVRMKQPADVTLSGSRVLVVLHARNRSGLSNAVLDFARSLG